MLTAVPLLDEELGSILTILRFSQGKAVSAPGWDGEFGPFLCEWRSKGELRLHRAIRLHFVGAGWQDTLGLLGQIETEEQLARMDAFGSVRIASATPRT